MKTLNKTTLSALLAIVLIFLITGCELNDQDLLEEGDNVVVDDGEKNNEDDDGGNDDVVDYSRSGVFRPIVKDNDRHFMFGDNDNLAFELKEFKTSGHSDLILVVVDFEWNEEELTMPLVQLISGLGYDYNENNLNGYSNERKLETIRKMFNDCEIDDYKDIRYNPYFTEGYIPSNSHVVCGGTDKNNDKVDYIVESINKGFAFRTYINDWIYDEPLEVLIPNGIKVVLNIIYNFNDGGYGHCEIKSSALMDYDNNLDVNEFRLLATTQEEFISCEFFIIEN